MIKETAKSSIIKPNDDELLKLIVDDLPKENFYIKNFIRGVKLAAQGVRKIEQKQNARSPRGKLMRPDRQKTYVKKTLRNQAFALYSILRTLPDDSAMRVDNQHLSSEHDDDRYILSLGTSFTELARDITKLLVEYCDNSYQFSNPGWRNPYKTQEAFIGLSWRQSGAEITTTVNGDFFNALCNFRNYCQVPGYDQDKVSSTEISRIISQLS